MTWILDEASLTKIRQPMAIYDDGDALADACIPSGAELQVSHTGTLWANATGTLVRIGSGGFYYQGVVGDAAVEGFTAIKLAKTGFITAIAYAKVFGSSGRIWIPITLWNAGDLATGCVPSGAGELEMSLNGGAWIAATGSFHEIGSGAYYYLHDVDDLDGFLAIKVLKAGFDEAIAWGSVDVGGSPSPSPSPPTPPSSLPVGIPAGIGIWSLGL